VLLAFRKCFGDVYQFWLSTTHFVVANGADDVKLIFTHRKTYDHGGMLVETGSVLVENSILVLTGEYCLFHNYSLSFCSSVKYKRHSALTVPLLRRAKIVLNLDIIIDCTDRLLAK
jgi:hypothetical protein